MRTHRTFISLFIALVLVVGANAKFLVSTTGTPTTVVLQDLGGRTLTHPVVDLDLELEFTDDELTRSQSVKDAIDGGEITVKDASGNPITDSADIDMVAELMGATDSVDGVGGIVPAPLAGEDDEFLRGDGTWAVVSPSSPTEIIQTGDASTTSATYVVITGMTSTPTAGQYFVSFSASGSLSDDDYTAKYAIQKVSLGIELS